MAGLLSGQDLWQQTNRLRILYIGDRNTLYKLDEDAFTKINFVEGTTLNSTLGTDTPKGVLGASVAVVKGEGICGGPTPKPGAAPVATERPIGLFINDAAGRAFEGVSAISSGKLAIANHMGSHAINTYETNERDASGVHTAALLVYAAGDWLYCDTVSGLLTKVEPTGTNGILPEKIAYVTKAPTSTDPFMVIELII